MVSIFTNMKTLSEKVILVTGASRGIGAVIAQQLAQAGAKVIVNYAGGKDAADQTVAGIIESGGDAIAVQGDVSNSEQVKNLFDAAIDHYGRIDVLINNAGIMIFGILKDTTDEDFDRQFNVNVKGTFNTMREAATRLADHGTVINFSTSANRMMLPGYSTYVATKAAVEQLTRIFSKEVGARGINVNSVSPGPTNTELFTNGKSQEVIDRLAALSPFNRIGESDDIAKVVVFLASDAAKWINAQNIGVNGGTA
ncbi:3-oxoacyl-[acyl-carrier protein] reductase [Pedobacter metabolipauper]|uniref:3-oxoacyl-[acyl-carrier protein] reductase n=2 Tax=Pedobacter metabolipauper TaxID=425513 RepID=A0A4R6SY15_9SPHI|nr:3-oxoacyl-[acyl-carrier protein] reductase [Pedobacter metabolipauper]